MKKLFFLIVGLLLTTLLGCDKSEEQYPPIAPSWSVWVQLRLVDANGANLLSEMDGQGLAKHRIGYVRGMEYKKVDSITIQEDLFNTGYPPYFPKLYDLGIVKSPISENMLENIEWDNNANWVKECADSFKETLFWGAWSSDMECSDTILIFIDESVYQLAIEQKYEDEKKSFSPNCYIYVDGIEVKQTSSWEGIRCFMIDLEVPKRGVLEI